MKFVTDSGKYVDEASEKANTIEIDEANLYCTGDNPYGEHDIMLLPFSNPEE